MFQDGKSAVLGAPGLNDWSGMFIFVYICIISNVMTTKVK